MKRKENRKSGNPFILLIIIAIASAGIYAETRYNIISDAFGSSYKRLVPEGVTFEYEPDLNVSFSRGKNGLLCVTGDGATYYSFKGEKLGSVTFTLQSPRIVKKAENWAVLEPMGRTVYVCGQNGLIYTVMTEYPITTAYLNSIQCLVLILETGKGYEIRVYNGNGEETMTRNYELEGVYPVYAAISDDGYYLCVSCLDTTKTTLSSKLQYFYTDSGAKRFGTDMQTPFKVIEKPNSVIAKMFFSGNGNMAGVSDNEVFITTPKGEEVFTLALQNRLKYYSFGETAFGFVTGLALANTQGESAPGIARWFDYGGKLLAEYPPEKSESPPNAEMITLYDEFTVLKSDDGYIMTDLNGKQVWTYGAAEDIIEIIPADKKRAVIAKRGGAEVYLLKKPRADEEDG